MVSGANYSFQKAHLQLGKLTFSIACITFGSVIRIEGKMFSDTLELNEDSIKTVIHSV